MVLRNRTAQATSQSKGKREHSIFIKRIMVSARPASYSYQNDYGTRERSSAILRLHTASSKTLLPSLKSKMLPILRDAAGFYTKQQSKLGSEAPLLCLSSKKEGEVLRLSVAKNTPIPSEGRRIFPNMRLIILLEKKGFLIKCFKTVSTGQMR